MTLGPKKVKCDEQWRETDNGEHSDKYRAYNNAADRTYHRVAKTLGAQEAPKCSAL
jgi:hypothetical protein